MLFLSRAWLEDLSELFLVRKADFLKLKILSEKLVLERGKKKKTTTTPTHNKITPTFYKEKDTLKLYPSKKKFFLCRKRQEQTYAFSIWHYSGFKHFEDGFHAYIPPFKPHKDTKNLTSVYINWKIKSLSKYLKKCLQPSIWAAVLEILLGSHRCFSQAFLRIVLCTHGGKLHIITYFVSSAYKGNEKIKANRKWVVLLCTQLEF